MSEPTGAKRYGTGGGDAYYDAVKYGGYPGTREQFGQDQARFAENAKIVAEAKIGVDEKAQEIDNKLQTFSDTTLPAAIEAVQQEGQTQTQQVIQQGIASSQQVETVGTEQKDGVANEGRARIYNIQTEGDTQIQRIQDGAAAQIAVIGDKGAEQIAAVEATGRAVKESIPADYQSVIANSLMPQPAAPYVENNTVDLNAVREPGFYILDTSWGITNGPAGFVPTGLIVENFSPVSKNIFVQQTVLSLIGGAKYYYTRGTNARGEWSAWSPSVDNTLTLPGVAADAVAVSEQFSQSVVNKGVLEPGADCNNVLINSIYFVSANGSQAEAENYPTGYPGWLQTVVVGDSSSVGAFQLAYPWGPGRGDIFYRCYSRSAWGAWIKVTPTIDTTLTVSGAAADAAAVGAITLAPKPAAPYVENNTVDLNDIVEQGNYILDGTWSLVNAPVGFVPTGLIVEKFTDRAIGFVRQTAVKMESIVGQDRQFVRHSNTRGVWSEWSPVGESVVNNVTKNITESIHNNTYNITTNPTIETNTNGWLSAIDNEDTPESSATDMTGAIMSMLRDTGYCKLSPGVFYVSGGIDMPSGSMIEGCGSSTVLRLFSGNDNYILRPIRYSTIKNMRLSGGKTFVPTADIGGRNGVYFYDTKTDFSQPGSVDIRPCVVDNVQFDHFSGAGIYGHGTGGGTAQMLMVTDCFMESCTCGINIDFFTEYSKFVSVVTRDCYYGCINNGGNNVFVGCTFHGAIGFVIDNSANDKLNYGHGSCHGCTFNHVGGNHGYSIKIDNCNLPYLFEGCNWWYGKIGISDSSGIIFNGMEGGGTNAIEVINSHNILFANGMLNATPTITLTGSDNVKFKDMLNCATGTYIGV